MNAMQVSPAQILMVAVLGLGAILFHLAPLQLTADARVLPDLLLVLACLWTVRQPQNLPLPLLACLLLIADFALSRPVGLWAMISLLMVEAMGAQREALRSRPFPLEWATFGMVLAIGLGLQSLILSLALVPRPDGTQTLHLFAITLGAHPLGALLLTYVLRVRSPKPAERSRRLGRVA